MNRKEAIELLPIIQAYAEGKEIEIFDKTMKMWKTAMLPHFDCDSNNYRIKPGPKYRPFKDAKECRSEMLKHQPFGWLIGKEDEYHSLITSIIADEEEVDINGISGFVLDEIMEHYTFVDGLPFGVKVEE